MESGIILYDGDLKNALDFIKPEMIEEFIQTIKENQSWMFTYTRLIS